MAGGQTPLNRLVGPWRLGAGPRDPRCPDLAGGVGVVEDQRLLQVQHVNKVEIFGAQQEKIFIQDLGVMDSFVWKQNPPRYADWVRLWNEVKAS